MAEPEFTAIPDGRRNRNIHPPITFGAFHREVKEAFSMTSSAAPIGAPGHVTSRSAEGRRVFRRAVG